MTITAPDAPTLPSLNDPANFNTRALALFSWLVTEYIPWLETLAGVTEDGEINGTPIGQKAAAAGKFTSLLADSLGGAAVQSSATDTVAGKLLKLATSGHGAFGLGGTLPASGNIDQLLADGVTGWVRASSGAQGSRADFTSVLTMAQYDGIGTQVAFGIGNNTPLVSVRGDGGGGDPGPWFDLKTDYDVQSNYTDTTAGKLMKVGAFGLGETIELYGTDSLQSRQLPTGFYSYSAASVAGAPENVAYAHNLQVIHSELANRRTYIASRATGSVSSARMWWGVGTGTDPIAWTPIAMGGFTVGTVSQSGGLPTGAVIERGSNANGDYVRFADGTQICRINLTNSVDVTNPEGNLFSSSSYTWTYPAEFAAGGQIVVAGAGNQALTWLTANNIGLESANIRLVSTSSGTGRDLRAMAIGRWF